MWAKRGAVPPEDGVERTRTQPRHGSRHMLLSPAAAGRSDRVSATGGQGCTRAAGPPALRPSGLSLQPAFPFSPSSFRLLPSCPRPLSAPSLLCLLPSWATGSCPRSPPPASQPRPPLPLAPPQVCCTGVLPRCGRRKQVGLTLPRAGHVPLRDLALPLAVRLWMTTCVCREPGRRHPPQGSLMPAVRKSPRPCCCGRFAHSPVQGSQKGLHFST